MSSTKVVETTAAAIADFADLLIDRVSGIAGSAEIERIVGTPPGHSGFLRRGADKAALALAALPKEEQKQKVATLAQLIENGFGFTYAEDLLEDVFIHIEKKYSPDLAGTSILPLVPEEYLGKFRLRHLSKEDLTAQVLEKTKELHQLNAGLEAQVEERTLKLKQLLEQQEENSKQLIRRDLELTRANEQLRSLDEMKTDFVSVATHQLRTPLSAIRWTLSMLLNGDLGPLSNEQRTFLMKAYESNNRMIALIGDMLFADQIESGKLKSTFYMTTALPDLLDNLLLELNPLAQKKQVKIIFEHPAEPYPLARIDSPNIRAVMQNLVENAVKYTDAGGSVTITLGKDSPDTLAVTVADTGIGIPQDEQQHLFTRFYRAKNAKLKETDGSGLGLFIAKQIVEKYHGKIWFESSADKGTTFHVTLPAAPPENKTNVPPVATTNTTS